MDRLTHAMDFATQEHVLKRGQRYGVLPYTHHLAAVDAEVQRFALLLGESESLEDYRVAAWLHDILEDCPGIKRKDIVERFGDRVAELVWAVTNEPGENRRVRQALTYEKTRTVHGGVFLKLADRLANVRAGGSLLGMYRKEFDGFKRSLYTPGHLAPIWFELDYLLHFDPSLKEADR